jgi:hypothetical protein
MKRLDTTEITTNVGFPFKSGTLDFLQDANKEVFQKLLSPLIPNPVTDLGYILSGVQNTGTGQTYNISSGVIYLNGEIFDFEGTNFTKTASQIAGVTIETTQFTINADPVEFTDGIVRNVHNIRKIIIEPKPLVGSINFDDFQRASYWLKGDIKQVNCDITYYNANFDSNGIGKKDRLGWKVCEILKGRTLIGYDPATNFIRPLGFPLGSDEHTLTIPELPEHTHDAGSYNTGIGTIIFSQKGLNSGNDIVYSKTKPTGGGQSFPIIQSSTIILIIEKL